MKLSNYFLPVLKENPKLACVVGLNTEPERLVDLSKKIGIPVGDFKKFVNRIQKGEMPKGDP